MVAPFQLGLFTLNAFVENPNVSSKTTNFEYNSAVTINVMNYGKDTIIPNAFILG